MLENKNIRNLSDLKGGEFPLDTASLWSGIESGIAAGKKRRVALWWISGLAGSLLLLFFVWLGLHQFSGDKPTASNTQPADLPNNESPQELKVAKEEPISQKENDNTFKLKVGTTAQKPGTAVKNQKSDPIPNPNSWVIWTMNPKPAEFNFKISSFNPDLESLIPGFKSITEPKKEKIKLGWEVFAATTPNFADKLTSKDQQLGWRVNKDFERIAELSEKSAAGFQVQLGAQLNIGSHWFIQSGLNYSEKREWVKYNHTLTEFPIVRASERKLEYAPLNPAQWVNVNHQGNNEYSFLEIPIQVGYRAEIGAKLEWRTRMGVSYWRLLETKGSKINPTDLLLENLSETKNYRNNSLGSAVYSGLYYKLNNQWQIMAEPSASVSVSNLTVNTPVKTHPYQYGLNIGVQYRIK